MADIPLAKSPLPLAELAGADAAASGEVPTSDGAGGVTWDTPSGGGGAGALAHKFVRSATGTTSINTSSSWANLTTHVASFTDISLTGCSAGDVIQVQASAGWANEGTSKLLDVATIVAGSVVNLFSSGSSTPSTSGVKCWEGVPSAYMPFGGASCYALQAGDLSAGAVTLRLRVRTSGTARLYHDEGQWSAINLGPVQS